MTAEVLKPGPLTTVQDLGRRGVAHLGLSPGGAMDRTAFLWANRLLGNSPNAPALEVAIGGLAMRFAQETHVAVTGAHDPAGPAWRVVTVAPGHALRLGTFRTGRFAYVAFPGGLEAPRFEGSASVVVRDELPGFGPLREGDTLSWRGNGSPAGDLVPPRYRPTQGGRLETQGGRLETQSGRLELGFVPSYEWEAFSPEDRDTFLQTAWAVTPESNRVATRLKGPSLGSGPQVLDSVPLVDGTIQVLGDGTPIVFMRDRPTIGGYAKLGSVVPTELDRLAQAMPGCKIAFVRADSARARLEAAEERRFFGLSED